MNDVHHEPHQDTREVPQGKRVSSGFLTRLGNYRFLSLIAFLGTAIGLFLRWDYVLWSSFALVCAALQYFALSNKASEAKTEKIWRVAAIATGGLLLYWVLVALPTITSNAGFVLTVSVAAAGGALWLAPHRPRS